MTWAAIEDQPPDYFCTIFPAIHSLCLKICFDQVTFLNGYNMADPRSKDTDGLACAAVFVCVFFSLAGFSQANSCAVKPLVLPIFVSRRNSPNFSTGICH